MEALTPLESTQDRKPPRLGFFALGAATMSGWIVQGLVIGSDMDVGAVTVVLFLLLVTSWVAAVYVCIRLRASRAIHLLALVFLIPLGFFVGWVYLLFASHALPERSQGDAT
jgi:hypothetical protein